VLSPGADAGIGCRRHAGPASLQARRAQPCNRRSRRRLYPCLILPSHAAIRWLAAPAYDESPSPQCDERAWEHSGPRVSMQGWVARREAEPPGGILSIWRAEA